MKGTNGESSPVLNECREFESILQRPIHIVSNIFVETLWSPIKCEAFSWLVQCRRDA
jgi:hypothetical protein